MPDEMPPPVDDRYRYWNERPPEFSARCLYWIDRLNDFGHPNSYDWRDVQALMPDGGCAGYDGNAEHFGVYMWEWFNIIYHILNHVIDSARERESRPKLDIDFSRIAPIDHGVVENNLPGVTKGTMTIKGFYDHDPDYVDATPFATQRNLDALEKLFAEHRAAKQVADSSVKQGDTIVIRSSKVNGTFFVDDVKAHESGFGTRMECRRVEPESDDA